MIQSRLGSSVRCDGLKPNRFPIKHRLALAAFLISVASISTSARAQLVESNSSRVPAPATVDPLDAAARIQLDRADALFRGKSWVEALEAYRRVANQFGGKLIEWPERTKSQAPGFTQYCPVREFIWWRLSELHRVAPEVFSAYRRQIDPQASRWLGDSTDPAGPARVANDLFLSSVGDDALLRLGESALERGQSTAARRYLERISPQLKFIAINDPRLRHASARPLWLPFYGTSVDQVWPMVAELFEAPSPPVHLTYPDADVDLPLVRARLIMASLLENNLARASVEIDLLRIQHPDAIGTVGGQQGNLAQIGAELLQEAETWPSVQPSDDWSTFAGSVSRQRIGPDIRPFTQEPAWSVPLPRLATPSEITSANRVRVAEETSGLLSYFPLVVDEFAVVQTGYSREHVQAYRLADGTAALPELDRPSLGALPLTRRNFFGVPRFIPECSGTNLFLISGMPWLTSLQERDLPVLEAIDLAAERKLLWTFSPGNTPWGAGWLVAGPSVVHQSRMFLPLRRREPVRDEMQMIALDLRDGQVLWRQTIGASEPAVDPQWTELSHQLLTAHEDTVYWNTNGGLVAALDIKTGHVRWISSYPRTAWSGADPDRNALHFYRDLNPCLVHQGLVIAAPRDCNRIFALEATSGRLIWSTPAGLAADAIHLLGVVDNRLAVSGECVYWFDAWTGRLAGMYPEPFKAAQGYARPNPRGFGRGILVGRHLYWPTENEVLVFDQTKQTAGRLWQPDLSRTISLAPHGIRGGNLTFARETLLLASADRLVAWKVSTMASEEPLSNMASRLQD